MGCSPSRLRLSDITYTVTAEFGYYRSNTRAVGDLSNLSSLSDGERRNACIPINSRQRGMSPADPAVWVRPIQSNLFFLDTRGEGSHDDPSTLTQILLVALHSTVNIPYTPADLDVTPSSAQPRVDHAPLCLCRTGTHQLHVPRQKLCLSRYFPRIVHPG